MNRITTNDGRTLCFGRNHPENKYPVLRLKDYLNANALPTPPSSYDYVTGGSVALAPMYMNDTLGDCVCAAMAHTLGLMVADAADNNAPSNTAPLIYTNNQVVSLYSGACGYANTSQTDQGCDIQTVFKYVEKNDFPQGSNNTIAGYLTIDHANTYEQQLAIYLFENLIFGIDMPSAWVNPEPNSNGFVWDVAGAPDNSLGHCFPGFSYDTTGKVEISTWSMVGYITANAITKYCDPSVYGELYTVISTDALNKASQLAPNGLDWATLVSDFDSLGGNVVIANTSPQPNTTPQPNTVPVNPPTPVSNNIIGSAQWLQENLTPVLYNELIAVYKAVEHWNPEKNLVSSAGWLKVHLSNTAWNDLYTSIISL